MSWAHSPVVICWNPQQHKLFVLWHHYLCPYWRSKTFAKNLLLVSLPPLELQDINHLVLLLALTVSAQSTMWCNCKSPFKHFISYSYRSWSRSRRCYRSSNTFFTSTFINTKKKKLCSRGLCPFPSAIRKLNSSQGGMIVQCWLCTNGLSC